MRFRLRTLLIVVLGIVLMVAAAAAVESLGEGWGTLIGIVCCLPAIMVSPIVLALILYYKKAKD